MGRGADIINRYLLLDGAHRSLRYNVDGVSWYAFRCPHQFIERSTVLEPMTNQSTRSGQYCSWQFIRHQVCGEQFAEELTRSLFILFKHHEVVQIDVGRDVSTKLDANDAAILKPLSEEGLLFDRTDLYGDSGEGKSATNKEFTEKRLNRRWYATPLVKEKP